MNITDTIDNLAKTIFEGRDPDETIDSYINGCGYDIHAEILDEIGDRDLSDPRPDLTKGWREIRSQLAYNALYGAVMSAARELGHEAGVEPCEVCGHFNAGHTCCPPEVSS